MKTNKYYENLLRETDDVIRQARAELAKAEPEKLNSQVKIIYDELNSKMLKLDKKLDEIIELLKSDKMEEIFLNSVRKACNELKQ